MSVCRSYCTSKFAVNRLCKTIAVGDLCDHSSGQFFFKETQGAQFTYYCQPGCQFVKLEAVNTILTSALTNPIFTCQPSCPSLMIKNATNLVTCVGTTCAEPRVKVGSYCNEISCVAPKVLTQTGCQEPTCPANQFNNGITCTTCFNVSNECRPDCDISFPIQKDFTCYANTILNIDALACPFYLEVPIGGGVKYVCQQDCSSGNASQFSLTKPILKCTGVLTCSPIPFITKISNTNVCKNAECPTLISNNSHCVTSCPSTHPFKQDIPTRTTVACSDRCPSLMANAALVCQAALSSLSKKQTATVIMSFTAEDGTVTNFIAAACAAPVQYLNTATNTC